MEHQCEKKVCGKNFKSPLMPLHNIAMLKSNIPNIIRTRFCRMNQYKDFLDLQDFFCILHFR